MMQVIKLTVHAYPYGDSITNLIPHRKHPQIQKKKVKLRRKKYRASANYTHKTPNNISQPLTDKHYLSVINYYSWSREGIIKSSAPWAYIYIKNH